MSQENIATAQRAIEAWNRLDLDGSSKRGHPDAEWRPAFPKGTEGTGGVFRGHEGIIRETWLNVRAGWAGYRVEGGEARMVGENLLILECIYSTRTGAT